MKNVEFAQDLKRMMDAWDKIADEVYKRYSHKSSTERYEITGKLFEKLAGLDKNKGRG